MSYRLVLVFLILILLGIFQNTNFFNFYGIKPNLVLVFLIAASFFVSDFLIFFLLSLAGAIVSSFSGGFEFEKIALILIASASYFIGNSLNWPPFFSNLFLVAAGTTGFYLLVNPSFIFSSWLIVGEVFYNTLWAIIFFKITELCLKTNSMLKI